MSSCHKIREDKTCLNCRCVVEKKFCPNCGQENSESRKSFHQLFFHFFEDLTHYENSFWKTIRFLLFKPGKLTIDYMKGMRNSYLTPIKLYIFISFATFLGLVIFNNDMDVIDLDTKEINRKPNTTITYKDYIFKNHKELEKVHENIDESKKLNLLEYKALQKYTDLSEKYSGDELILKFKEKFFNSLPKMVILYMPFFAFFLWLFHNKKKWFYFDHGIFTLHYFSFILLVMFVMNIINYWYNSLIDLVIFDVIHTTLNIVSYLWIFLYFFKAHKKFYEASNFKTIFKGTIIFVVNVIFFIIFIMLSSVMLYFNLK